ncbi:zinc metallopeptidase, partial [Enterocloster bolteae]
RNSIEQRYLELFQRYLKRQTTYDWHTACFQGRNNYCKTDPDATFMHMKDDHMRNAQLKPGYNVQIGVDSEYIVAVDIFQDRYDVWTLVPFLKRIKEKLGFKYPSVTADTTSIAAIGVAAHECGHAMQDANDYSPLRIRAALV